MWPSRRRQRRNDHNQHNCNNARRKNSNAAAAVGTEAKAIENIKKNSKAFGYPKEGFISRIEHSLTYNMISEPDVYPEDVVLKQIAEEDFESYLYVAASEISNNPNSSSRNNSSGSLRDDVRIEADDASGDDDDDDDNDDNHIVSYAQLSAIVALSLQKYPPPKEDYEDQQSQQSVPQSLCKSILQCVVKYATRHDLDREAEVRELLDPVERQFARRNDAAQLKNALPFYVGYAATLITANPLPMLVGVSVMASTGDAMIKEQRNMNSIAKQSSRLADVEKTGLLDETDDF